MYLKYSKHFCTTHELSFTTTNTHMYGNIYGVKICRLMLQVTENSCFILALRTRGNVVMSTDLSLTDI